MRNVRLFRALLGVDKRTVIEDIEFEEDDAGDGAGDRPGAATKCSVAPLWSLRSQGVLV